MKPEPAQGEAGAEQPGGEHQTGQGHARDRKGPPPGGRSPLGVAGRDHRAVDRKSVGRERV